VKYEKRKRIGMNEMRERDREIRIGGWHR